MQKNMTKLFFLGLIVFLTGCGTPIERHAFNKESAQKLKTFDLAKNTQPETYNVNIIAHPGMSFGLIGGLIAAADLSSKSTTLTNALDPKETQLKERLAATLRSNLEQLGYITKIVNTSSTGTAKETLATLQPSSQSDAILITELNIGYIAAGVSTPYQPYLSVNALLSDSKTGQILYQDTITYGYTFQNSESVHLNADPKFSFSNMEALTKEKDTAREALFKGIEAISAQISNDLKRN